MTRKINLREIEKRPVFRIMPLERDALVAAVRAAMELLDDSMSIAGDALVVPISRWAPLVDALTKITDEEDDQ